MKTFARIDAGRVVEIILQRTYEADAPAPADGSNIPPGWPTFKKGDIEPIDARYSPEIVATLVEITDKQVGVGDVYANGEFLAYVPPDPTPAEIITRNTAMRDASLALAAQRIAPLQDAVDLGEATGDETARLTSWKRYRVDVNRVDLTLVTPGWPTQPPK